MVQSIQRRAGLTGVGGSTHAFNARERRKSLKDPAAGLFVSHDFGVDNSNIATGNLFPDRHRPITFSFSVTRTGNSAAGIIAEFGSSANGFAVWVDDLHLGFAIGSSGLNGITIVTEDILKTIGERYNIVVSCIPNKGIACVWEGGKVVGSAFTPSRKMPNGWSDGENGALKQINGTVNSRVPVASRVSLTDVALASRFAVYNGQYPRQFVLHSNTQDGLCSGSSPALVHTDFMSSRFYTRTEGQLGVTSNDFADLLTFTGPAGRTYTNADGDLVTVGLNESRLGNHIDTGSGLFDAGLLLESEDRTNLVRYSEELAIISSWSQFGGVTVESAGELSGRPAFRLIDENTSKYAQLSQSGIAHVGGVHVFQVLVAKDESPTSQFSVRLFYSVDEVSTTSGMSLSVDTGSIVNKWDTNVIERAAEDLGDKWLFWFAVDLTGAGDVTVQVFPAHDDTSGNASSANVGSQVCTAVDLHYGRYPQSYIKTEATSVTLAGETLQIDAPVLARAIGSPGPELVDTTWINNDPNTLVADGDQLTLTRQIGASEVVAASNPETLTAGETYLLSIPILSRKNNFPVGLYHGTTQIAQSDEVGTLEVFYTPDTTTTATFALRLAGS